MKSLLGTFFREKRVEVSTKKLNNDSKLEEQIRNNNGNLPDITISGGRIEKDDKALLKLIIRHCNETTEKLTLMYMDINISAKELKLFPMLKELTFCGCSIKNLDILRFNRWCPNITVLIFDSWPLPLAAYNTLISSEPDQPLVKTLAINFEYSKTELSREFLSALNQQFPSIEHLEMNLDLEDFSKHCSICNVPYEALYFKKLKKLSVNAFGEEIEKLFDYMAISNLKLKDLSFSGMSSPTEILRWIADCKKLAQLDLYCPYLYESELTEVVKGMKMMTKVTIYAKYLHWEPEDIIEFVRDNPRLRTLQVESDRKNREMVFDDKFKNMFADLIKTRNKITIKIEFHQGSREMKISEKGFNEIECSAPVSDDEE